MISMVLPSFCLKSKNLDKIKLISYSNISCHFLSCHVMSCWTWNLYLKYLPRAYRSKPFWACFYQKCELRDTDVIQMKTTQKHFCFSFLMIIQIHCVIFCHVKMLSLILLPKILDSRLQVKNLFELVFIK